MSFIAKLSGASIAAFMALTGSSFAADLSRRAPSPADQPVATYVTKPSVRVFTQEEAKAYPHDERTSERFICRGEEAKYPTGPYERLIYRSDEKCGGAVVLNVPPKNNTVPKAPTQPKVTPPQNPPEVINPIKQWYCVLPNNPPPKGVVYMQKSDCGNNATPPKDVPHVVTPPKTPDEPCPCQPGEDKPHHPHGDKPHGDKPHGDKPHDNKPDKSYTTTEINKATCASSCSANYTDLSTLKTGVPTQVTLGVKAGSLGITVSGIAVKNADGTISFSNSLSRAIGSVLSGTSDKAVGPATTIKASELTSKFADDATGVGRITGVAADGQYHLVSATLSSNKNGEQQGYYSVKNNGDGTYSIRSTTASSTRALEEKKRQQALQQKPGQPLAANPNEPRKHGRFGGFGDKRPEGKPKDSPRHQSAGKKGPDQNGKLSDHGHVRGADAGKGPGSKNTHTRDSNAGHGGKGGHGRSGAFNDIIPTFGASILTAQNDNALFANRPTARMNQQLKVFIV